MLLDAEGKSEQASKILGHVHLVDVFNGTVGQRFKCFRCERRLPENMFCPLGPKFLKAGRRPLTALHPWCSVCRGQAKGRWINHPLYTPELDRFWKKKFSGMRSAALSRSIFVGIDYQDLLGRYLEQDGICALSGLKMQPFESANSNIKSGRNMASPSVDRVDSNKHYTSDNIQIIMTCVNTMKGELPQDVFIEFCAQISTHQMLNKVS